MRISQIATLTGIPKPYYDKMRKEAPKLLANNIEEWFQKYPAKRLFPTFVCQRESLFHSLDYLSDVFRPDLVFGGCRKLLAPFLENLLVEYAVRTIAHQGAKAPPRSERAGNAT